MRFLKSEMNTYGDYHIEIKFDLLDRRIRLRNSRLLLRGSLVVLFKENRRKESPENIQGQEPIFFIVKNNENMHKKSIFIAPYSIKDVEKVDYSCTYTMVESPVFFAANESIIKSLKEKDNVPFADIILRGNNDLNEPPEYIVKNPRLCISPILKDSVFNSKKSRIMFKFDQQFDRKPKECISNCIKTWVAVEETCLDQSQNESIKNVFRSKVAIIQGPPGTGKTYVGRKIAEIIGCNPSIRSPMVVICYTNHALDSFLEPLLDSFPTMVRIGTRSRSKNQRYLDRNLKKLMGPYTPRSIKLELNHYQNQLSYLNLVRKTLQTKSTDIFTRNKDIFGDLFTLFPNEKADVVLKEWRNGNEKVFIQKRRNNMKKKKQRIKRRKDSYKEAKNDNNRGRNLERNMFYFRGDDENINNGFDPFQLINEEEEEEMFVSKNDPKNNNEQFDIEKEREECTRRFTKNFNLKHIERIKEKEKLEPKFSEQKEEVKVVPVVINQKSKDDDKNPDIMKELEVIMKKYDKVKVDVNNDDLEKKTLEKYDIIRPKIKNRDKPKVNDIGGEIFDLVKENDEVPINERDDKFLIDQMIKDRQLEESERVDAYDYSDGINLNDFFIKKSDTRLPEEICSFLQNRVSKLKENYNKTVVGEEFSFWRIDKVKRKEFYQNIIDGMKPIIKRLETKYFEKIAETVEKRSEIRMDLELGILRNCKIVGLTSTRAAISRKLLSSLKAPVYIIEEAAELLEGQIIAALPSNGCEHLILIGDHKQLKPKYECYNLKDFKIDLSMFERLVNIGLKCNTINVQQRMDPQISQIMRICFYPDLIDHESIRNYPPIAGLTHRLQFVSHDRKENTSDFSRSKINLFEAEFIARLCVYLTNQKEYSEKDITVITPYKGQMFEIRRLLEERKINIDKEEGLRVETVDDFQGEENNIIIVSLVRSTRRGLEKEKSTIGFVKIQNRIVVCLSRAKNSLIVVGNTELLEEKSDDWMKIMRIMKSKKLVNPYLQCGCPNHPNNVNLVKVPDDFDDIIHGGCSMICNHDFKCGHFCKRLCHTDDHRCMEKCGKALNECEHFCKQICHFGKECKPCRKRIVYKFENSCGHTKKIRCSDDKQTLKCTEFKCGRVLECSHKCQAKCCDCSDEGCVQKCRAKVECGCIDCKRIFKMECGSEPNCYLKCKSILSCGHVCGGKCFYCNKNGHSECRKNCTHVLICSHKCSGRHECSTPCLECIEPCTVVCSHGIKCKNGCSQECRDCRKRHCNIGCKHRGRCRNYCWEFCDIYPCYRRCDKVNKNWYLSMLFNNNNKISGHPCLGLCSERCISPCMKCDSKKPESKQYIFPIAQYKSGEIDFDADILYKLPCGHIFLVEYLDRYMYSESTHAGWKKCPTCNIPITNIHLAKRYESVIKYCIREMNEIKKRIRLEIKERERKEDNLNMIKAMQTIQKGYGSGHWFKCPNSHLYFIGECGGAMEKSKCPECNAEIGGERHNLTRGNTPAEVI